MATRIKPAFKALMCFHTIAREAYRHLLSRGSIPLAMLLAGVHRAYEWAPGSKGTARFVRIATFRIRSDHADGWIGFELGRGAFTDVPPAHGVSLFASCSSFCKAGPLKQNRSPFCG